MEILVFCYQKFSRSLEHCFLTVGQNNFGNKIPFINRHLNLSSSTSNTSSSPTQRKSVAQQLFGNSLPPPGSEWVMPKLPIALYKSSKKVTITRTGMDKPLEYEFKIDNYKSSKGKKPVMPYVSREKLSRYLFFINLIYWFDIRDQVFYITYLGCCGAFPAHISTLVM